MIIDLIINRKDGIPYRATQFYNRAMNYGEVAHGITGAMDEGTEQDVKDELCRYIHEHGYNVELCHYINSVDWLPVDTYQLTSQS